MILYPFRLALAALTWPRRRCALIDETLLALADAQQCPDLIEPPEPEPDVQEITTEVVLDLANERWFEHGAEDVAAWDAEVSSDA